MSVLEIEPVFFKIMFPSSVRYHSFTNGKLKLSLYSSCITKIPGRHVSGCSFFPLGLWIILIYGHWMASEYFWLTGNETKRDYILIPIFGLASSQVTIYYYHWLTPWHQKVGSIQIKGYICVNIHSTSAYEYY